MLIASLVIMAVLPAQSPTDTKMELDLNVPNKRAAISIQAQPRMFQPRLLQQQSQSESKICYSLRSYIFERQDGHAPVLVGETTCTPLVPYTYKTSGPPSVKLLPAVVK